MVPQFEIRGEGPGRVAARTPAHVCGLTTLRDVATSMVASGVSAVLVENPVGPEGIILARDIIEALAVGADPDIVWAGEIMRPAPRMVSSEQLPIDIGAEMAANELDVVTVFDEAVASVRVASALDVLSAVLRSGTEQT